MDRNIVLIAHNLRSCHNVGSLLRTAEGLGITTVYLTGYTPYPITTNDYRLPYIAQKLHKQIVKTSLGAEELVSWKHVQDVNEVIADLKANNYSIVALEQAESAIDLETFIPPEKIALIVGREVEGIEESVLELTNKIISIPMLGKKESFNVVQAAAMALYKMRFLS